MFDTNALLVVGGLIVNLVSTAIIGTWKLSRVELALREAIAKAERETDTRIEHRVREFGETILAIRQKITEVELFCRDTFMRRDSFYKVQETIEANMQSLAD